MVTKSRMKEGYTQIQILKTTADALKRHGKMGDSYDDVIQDLIKKVEAQK